MTIPGLDAASLGFLDALLNAPSPSGYEQPAQTVVRDYAQRFAQLVRTDSHGNVIAAVNPAGSPKILLAGHADQIGLLVKNIDDRGFLWVQAIGGWDPMILLGQTVQVWASNGPIYGVMARKPIHLLTPEERKAVPEIKNLWIDIGAADGAEARSLVAVGDPVTVALGRRDLRRNLVFGPQMDDKTGVWTVMTAAERASRRNPQAAIFAVSTVQEEIGLRGVQTSAFGIQPDVGIVVDVTHATDCPTIDENQYGRIRVGQGPVVYRGPNVNPRVYQRLSERASARGLPIQVNALGVAASNDAAELQLSGSGVATGLVCLPNRYMHSPVEVVSLDDMNHAAELIAEFCESVGPGDSFIP